jgi:hypothetical protein
MIVLSLEVEFGYVGSHMAMHSNDQIVDKLILEKAGCTEEVVQLTRAVAKYAHEKKSFIKAINKLTNENKALLKKNEKSKGFMAKYMKFLDEDVKTDAGSSSSLLGLQATSPATPPERVPGTPRPMERGVDRLLIMQELSRGSPRERSRTPPRIRTGPLLSCGSG